MMTCYPLTGAALSGLSELPHLADGPVWIDLLDPAPEDIAALEAQLGFALPSRADMQEIEATSRLYTEHGAAFLTALVPARSNSDPIELEPVTFILTTPHLITLRYHEPRAFENFVQRASKEPLGLTNGDMALLAVLDAVIDRLADLLELSGRRIDALSRDIFAPAPAGKSTRSGHHATLQAIGRAGDLTSGIKAALHTLDRLVVYIAPKASGDSQTRRTQIKSLTQDIHSLQEQSSFLSQKITFQLDATLGLINIEQNGIIKIFSVVSVVFLPPTLVASIYGMNFALMPELDHTYGYPLALAGMLISAIVPFAFFKWRGWL